MTFRLDPITAVSRSRRLLSEMCAIDKSFEKTFERITLLTFDDYILAMFVILGFTLGHHSRTDLSAVIDARRTIEETPDVERPLRQFLSLAAQTPDELKTALWATTAEPTRDNIPSYDLRPMMKRPILVLPDDKLIVLDAAFCAAQAILGPLFNVAKGASVQESKRLFGVFGKAFENYCLKTLRSMYPVPQPPLFDPLSLNLRVTDASGREFETDAALTLSTSRTTALFEVKSAFIPDELISGRPEDYVQGLRRKYGVSEEEGIKGTAQLARFVSVMIAADSSQPRELEGVERVIPVLLVYDPLLDAPLHTEFLAQEFTMALAPDQMLSNGEMRKGSLRIAKLVTMTVDDLENLESSVKDFSLIQLLSSYSDGVPDRNISLNNYIALSPYFSKHIWYSQRLREEFSQESKVISRRLGIPEVPKSG
jgi:hypothetical protein